MNQENQEKETFYDIPAFNLPWLQGRIDKLNKKANKLGTEPITINILKEFSETRNDNGHKYTVLIKRLEINGISPKLAGWSFMGTIEHTDAGNILRIIKESEIPEEFRSVKRVCDHCNKDRNRKDTYLVKHEDGAFKQLGKTCLKDYTGHISPAYLGALALFIHQLTQSENERMGEEGGLQEYSCAPDTFLRMACEAVVADGGYISRKQAEFAKAFPTSDHAWLSLFPPKGKSTFTPLQSTESGQKLYDNVVKTLEELEVSDKKSDFEHNVVMTWKKEQTVRRNIGLLAAAILVHEKDLIKKIEFKKDKESNWVGEIKDRTDFTLTMHKKLNFDTMYGPMQILIMKDADGNIFTWKTGTGFNQDVFVGDEIKLKGTIKDHNTYNEIKQTVINRCKLLENMTESKKEVV